MPIADLRTPAELILELGKKVQKTKVRLAVVEERKKVCIEIMSLGDSLTLRLTRDNARSLALEIFEALGEVGI